MEQMQNMTTFTHQYWKENPTCKLFYSHRTVMTQEYAKKRTQHVHYAIVTTL